MSRLIPPAVPGAFAAYSPEMFADWTFVEDGGQLGSHLEKMCGEAVAFALNELAGDEISGFLLNLPSAYHDQERRPYKSVDAIRLSVGAMGGDVREPYLEVSIRELVEEFIEIQEEGWADEKDMRPLLRDALMKCVALLDESMSK